MRLRTTGLQDDGTTGLSRAEGAPAPQAGLRTADPNSRITYHVSRFSPFATQLPERSVALVITLILLAVITFMAITFLVLSRSEKNQVSTETEQAMAQMAANAALERAKSEALAPILAHKNEFDYDLMVSKNYINPNGFMPGIASFTNVNYDFRRTDGRPLFLADLLQNLANLLYDPRAPVFVVTNRVTGQTDFRFYHDLNRNGMFDPTGPVALTNLQNQPILDGNGNLIFNNFTGDPQWIGILERPGFPHSSSNNFIARMAYMVLPAGKTLDINYAHNHAKLTLPGQMLNDGFFRNQGVGTWEINLASFLADLNTNLWPFPLGNTNGTAYFYKTNFPPASSDGAAFDDAVSLLRYRYINFQRYLGKVSELFGPQGIYAFDHDFVDGYSGGPLMFGTKWQVVSDNDTPKVSSFGWPGSDNTNHYLTTQDLWDRTKIYSGKAGINSFVDRLAQAGTSHSTYDRYTYYRLLAQLGTDSSPESGKINLNYANVDLNVTNRFSATPVLPNMATNFIGWVPDQFFANTAIRLLANAGYAIGTGPTNILFATFNLAGQTNLHIQIYPTNFYTPSVHQMLQLAANIYDASTNRSYGVPNATNGFPTIFRPIFRQDGLHNVYIVGYREVVDDRMAFSGSAPATLDLSLNPAVSLGSIPAIGSSFFATSDQAEPMVYGVPLVIGARKGFPSFNWFAMKNTVRVTRKLQFVKTDLSQPPTQTNTMYAIGISNLVCLEAWNSYSNAYPRDLQMLVAGDMIARLTNDIGTDVQLDLPYVAGTGYITNRAVITNFLAGTWQGFSKTSYKGSFQDATRSLQIPVTNFTPSSAFITLHDAIYSYAQQRVLPIDSGVYDTRFPVPHLTLKLNTRLRFILVDMTAGRIVDYVNLAESGDPIDITTNLTALGKCVGGYTPDANAGSLWCTNRDGALTDFTVPTYGIRNQIAVGKPGGDSLAGFSWSNFQKEDDRPDAQAIFLKRLGGDAGDGVATFDAPYSPTRTVNFYTSWQINDPMVHYTIGDLTDGSATRRIGYDTDIEVDPFYKLITTDGKEHVSSRYDPWDWMTGGGDTDYQKKDALVRGSDDWEFLGNRYPNIAWLGRVHRGTPWQTVNLKQSTMDLDAWAKWAGDTNMLNLGQFSTSLTPIYGAVRSAYLTHPTNDFHILDLFTTAFNDNGARGQLNVNQTNLAAWSAVLGGVITLNNPLTDAQLTGTRPLSPPTAPVVIDPAGTYDPTRTTPPLARIVNAINAARTNTALNAFSHVGDILAVPELTVASPYLNTSAAQKQYGISDAAYERIPQQILGLLKCDHTPRFVIYSYGQSLKPADHSLYTVSGPYYQMCTNYQVTAEVATRAVVRIDGLQDQPPHPRAVVETFNVLGPDQ